MWMAESWPPSESLQTRINIYRFIMSTTFINDNFLLENKYAEELYHNYSKNQPIIDYHNHLSPQHIAENTIFDNITKVWINGDHYKWRAMRTLGINEQFITGNGSDKEKFLQWGKTVPYTMRNPLYHWTHLELARYFDIYDLLNEKSAEKIYIETSEKINSQAYSTQNLLKKVNAELVCTTEDPIDNLEYHQQLLKSNFEIKVSTAFRPDKVILITNDGYNTYINTLGEKAGITIHSFTDLCDALKERIDYFHKNGCKLSDHGLDQIYFEQYTESEVNTIFQKKRNNQLISNEEALK